MCASTGEQEQPDMRTATRRAQPTPDSTPECWRACEWSEFKVAIAGSRWRASPSASLSPLSQLAIFSLNCSTTSRSVPQWSLLRRETSNKRHNHLNGWQDVEDMEGYVRVLAMAVREDRTVCGQASYCGACRIRGARWSLLHRFHERLIHG